MVFSQKLNQNSFKVWLESTKAGEQGPTSSWAKKKRIKALFLFHSNTFHVNDGRCRLVQFSFTWLFCFFQKAKECYGRVLSAWFLFSGGREWVRQPDGWSLWFSRWLFCVVLSDTGQAHWHAASLPSSPPLPPPPPPPPPAESLLRRWIPAPLASSSRSWEDGIGLST